MGTAARTVSALWIGRHIAGQHRAPAQHHSASAHPCCKQPLFQDTFDLHPVSCSLTQAARSSSSTNSSTSRLKQLSQKFRSRSKVWSCEMLVRIFEKLFFFVCRISTTSKP